MIRRPFQPVSTRDTSISYRRIRIVEDGDVEALYPLIEAYIQKPWLADTVTEMVINTRTSPRPSYGRRLADNEEELGDLSPEPGNLPAIMENYVRGMVMELETTEAMLNHLAWKKRQLSGGPADPRNLVRSDDYEFTLTATVLLLSLCKNITTLYLGDVAMCGLLQEYLLESNYGRLPYPGLQKLERVVMVSGGDVMDDGLFYSTVEFLDYFRLFHRLPAIRSVSMEGVAEYQGERSLFVPKTSNLKSIHMGHCDIPSSMLGTIIRIPKALEELTVSVGGLWSIDGGSPLVFPKTLGKCLLEHKETLKVLDLDADYAGYCSVMKRDAHTGEQEDGRDGDGSEGDEEYCQSDMDGYFEMDQEISDSPLWSCDLPDTRKYGYTIGSLHDFTALTHLSIGVNAFMGPIESSPPPHRLATQPPFRLIDALPQNLEYFCLYGYVKGFNEDVDEHVDEFMQKRSERLPLLKEVKGIDETVEDLATKFGNIDNRREEELWEKPMVEFDWIEA